MKEEVFLKQRAKTCIYTYVRDVHKYKLQHNLSLLSATRSMEEVVYKKRLVFRVDLEKRKILRVDRKDDLLRGSFQHTSD